MIVTLIPFLLAARFEPSDPMSWTNDTEVTYLIQTNAELFHSGDSDCANMNFHLITMLSCKELYSRLECRFHDTQVTSTPADGKQKKRRKYVVEDLWTKQLLDESSIVIAYGENGQGSVWVSAKVGPFYSLMATLARLLIVGVDLSSGQIGNFETASNITSGHCRTKFFVTRTAPPVNHENSIQNLFLIPRPDESLARSLEIERYVQDNDCVHKYDSYSFWTARELRKADPIDVEAELISAENFMAINDHNFTSFSKIKTTVKNLKENTQYSIEESTSLSFQKINIPECLHCYDDNSTSQDDYSNGETNEFSG